jgi:polyhydroxyalkanoate synthesis regulator phasin
MEHTRILEQLERMVASGRLTTEEADRLRARGGTERFDEVITEVRSRHARVHTDAAVEAGTMSADEADGTLERVRQGDHSAALRRRIKGVD